jgi:hypothetical protein
MAGYPATPTNAPGISSLAPHLSHLGYPRKKEEGLGLPSKNCSFKEKVLISISLVEDFVEGKKMLF